LFLGFVIFMIVTIFKSIKATSAGFHKPVDYIFERIRIGKSKETVERLRTEGDKEKAKILKSSLPSICFSGEFKNRSKSGLIAPSGLICLDFDKYPSQEELLAERGKITSSQYTFACFISPSGNGLKVVVKIPAVEKDHKYYFKSLQAYFNSKHFDPQCSDVARVCFESFDPDIYINKNSEVYTSKTDKEEELNYTPIVPLTSPNRIIENLLKWFDAKFSMTSGGRNSNLFKLASAFNDYGIKKIEAESVLLKYSSKDFTDNEIIQVLNSAYSKHSNFGTKFFEDSFKKNKIERSIRSGKSVKDIKQEFKEEGVSSFIDNIKESMATSDFWDYSEKGKILLSPHKYKSFLQENKFFKFVPSGSNNFIFIKIDKNLIEDTNSNSIKDFTLNYLENLEGVGMQPFDFMANATKFFKDDYLNFLDTIRVNIKEDTKDTCYLYFENCAVEVTGKEIKKIDYLDLDGFVWKNQIINRQFNEEDPTDCIFEKFIKKISNEEEDRFISFCTLIGYLLHSYKTPANNKAVILNDETISENPNGGSGKGIFCNAIGKMKKMVSIDGKHFGFDKSFPYQLVQADTQILLFDDVKKNFAFENLFSLITEGITIEKKNKDAIKIDVNKSPKIIITTNYPIGGVGGSFERRKQEYEFSSYFSSKHTPYDEFGGMLFDWDEKEWSRFDNFMIICVQVYLTKGILTADFKNLELKKFIKETSLEFFEWIKEGAIDHEVRVYKALKYSEFIEEFSDFNKLTKKRFSQWTEAYATYLGAEYISGKDTAGRYFIIKNK